MENNLSICKQKLQYFCSQFINCFQPLIKCLHFENTLFDEHEL